MSNIDIKNSVGAPPSLQRQVMGILSGPQAEKYELGQDIKIAYESTLESMNYDGKELGLGLSKNIPENDKLKVFLVELSNRGFGGMKIFGREVMTSPLKSLYNYAEMKTKEKRDDNQRRNIAKPIKMETDSNQIIANEAMRFMIERAGEIKEIARLDKITRLVSGKEVKLENKSANDKVKNFRELVLIAQRDLVKKEFKKVVRN